MPPTLSELITGPKAERAPLQDVVRRIQELRAAGRTSQEAASEVQAMGWTPAEVKERIARIAPPSSIDSVAQGSSLGFADELNATLLSPVRAWKEGIGLPDARGQILEDKRTALELYRQQHPTAAMLSEVAGGAVMPMPSAGTRTAIGTVLKGAGIGAGAGALYGAGQGEDATSRIEGAILGGATGGVLGGGLGLLEGVLRGAITQTPAGARGTSRAMLADALADDGLTGTEAANRIAAARAAGDGGTTVADVAGPRVLGFLDDVANSPNRAQSALRNQITERQQGVRGPTGDMVIPGQYDRLVERLGQFSGIGHRRTVQTLSNIERARRAAARPAFDAAWQFDTASNQPIRDAFAALAGTDAGPKAYQRAVMIARNEMPGYRPPSWESLFDQQGNLTAVPDARFMHFMKMGLDDLYSSAVRGESGMGQTAAASIKSVRNQFRDTLKAENPAYGQALDQFAGSMAMQNAVEDGAAAMLKSPDELIAAMDGLGASERDAFRIGALTKVIDVLGNKRRGPATDVAGALTSPSFVRKIAALMPNDAARVQWFRFADLEEAKSRTAQVMFNSRTAPRQEVAELMNGDEGAGRILGDATQGLHGGFTGLFMAALSKISKPIAQFAKRQRRGAMGEMLSLTDGNAEAFLRGLDARPPAIGYQTPALAAPAAIGSSALLLPQPQAQPDH